MVPYRWEAERQVGSVISQWNFYWIKGYQTYLANSLWPMHVKWFIIFTRGYYKIQGKMANPENNLSNWRVKILRKGTGDLKEGWHFYNESPSDVRWRGKSKRLIGLHISEIASHTGLWIFTFSLSHFLWRTEKVALSNNC